MPPDFLAVEFFFKQPRAVFFALTCWRALYDFLHPPPGKSTEIRHTSGEITVPQARFIHANLLWFGCGKKLYGYDQTSRYYSPTDHDSS
jgi:hypothetical protein